MLDVGFRQPRGGRGRGKKTGLLTLFQHLTDFPSFMLKTLLSLPLSQEYFNSVYVLIFPRWRFIESLPPALQGQGLNGAAEENGAK